MAKLTEKEIEESLKNLDGWAYQEGAIEKTFVFANFKEAFSIMARIAFECEAQNHHPDWSNVYKTLNVKLNTHDAGGVTEKDFQLAKTIEEIASKK